MPLVTLTVIVKKTYKHLPTFKRMALNPNYYPTYGALAVGGALSLVYFTDWKVTFSTFNVFNPTSAASRFRVYDLMADRNSNPSVERILGATKVSNEIYFLVKLKNKELAEVIHHKVAYEKCPRLVIEFYEKRMSWN